MTTILVVSGILILLIAVLLPTYLRDRRLRKTFRSMPRSEHRRILALIDDFSKDNPRNAILIDTRWERPREDSQVLLSYFGGVPYLESNDLGLLADKEIRFIVQARLPKLPRFPWSGDLFVLFQRVRDKEFTVLRYPRPELDRCATLEEFRRLETIALLEPIRLPTVPYRKTVRRTTWSPRLLLKVVPGVQEAIAERTDDEIGLMSQVLRPNGDVEIDAWDVLQVGGKPNHIQEPQKLRCSVCRRPLLLVFQFGSSCSDKVKRDGSILYVFGCVKHREEIQHYLDFD